MEKGVFIDPWLLGGIGAFFTLIVIPGGGYMYRTLWTAYLEAKKEVIELLKQFFAEAEARKAMWQAHSDTVKENTRAIQDLAKGLAEFRDEWRRKNP